ncbi:DNA modification methylase [Maridesulfovibrio ferrireducens]|uniref:DNA modification methylase n=1 Tax=Maridesulfovibrio ferrireducens TaxID=246191 RepID=UPI001A1D4914|nr:DNA modification methylase [Maridesulfovibrio ferrireducens]MBI9112271.1 DNA modification methylase [Maridesulfovibrio ferrireducens]
MTKLCLEHWPLERFRSYDRNLKKHKTSVNKMIESIREFGFRIPVLAQSDGTIVDGELRLLAALQLEIIEIPVVLADGMTPQQIKAFRLMANSSSAWSKWDDESLALELSELRTYDFDLQLTGFALSDVEDLLEQFGPEFSGNEDPDSVPDIESEYVSKHGDLWILGEHRLLCGDSTSGADISRLMNNNSADMVFTDPPYNVNYEGKAGKIKNDNMSNGQFYQFLYDAFTAMFLALKKGGPIYVAHGESESINFRSAFQDAGFKTASCVIWAKNAFVLGRSDFQPQHEPILYGWKPGARHCWYGGRKKTSVQQFQNDEHMQIEGDSVQLTMQNRLLLISGKDLQVEELIPSVVHEKKPQRSDAHPTMKPVALVERFLKNSSLKNDIVLDSFGGSGSTLIACERTKRKCHTMELDPRFADVIVRRWQEFTGQTAILEFDGRTFEQVQYAGKIQ